MKLNLITIYLAAFALAIVFFLIARIYLPTSEVFSLGQFIIELLLVPSILLTLIEIRKIQSKPKLDLCFGETNGENPKEIELINQHYVDINVLNSGEAIAIWYSIQLDIPRRLWRGNPPLESHLWEEKIGDEMIHWQRDYEFEEEGREFVRLIFISNGQIAVYPHNPILLGRFYISDEFFPSPGQSGKHEFFYEIFSDSSKPVRGVLSIKLTIPSPQSPQSE